MVSAAVAAKATVVAKAFHRFSPHGVSGVLVIEESHLSIHTWPEVGYAAVDFYTCGDCLPEKAHQSLLDSLKARHAELMVVARGQLCSQQSMAVRAHQKVDSEGLQPSTRLDVIRESSL